MAGVTITVTVNVNHQRDHEVEIYLVAPWGDINNCNHYRPYNQPYTQCFTTGVIPLTNNRGGTGKNYVNTVFSDAAGTPIAGGTAPLPDLYRPEVPLNTLGGNPNGVWRLRMVDEMRTGYTGVYRGFSINFTVPGSGGSGSTLTWTSNPVDPSFTGTNLPGTYTVTPTVTTVYTLTANASNGCSAVSSATVTVDPAITVNAGSDQSNCNNGSFTLAGNTPSSGSGVWTVASGTASITSPGSPNSGVTGIPVGTSATLRWTITSAPCSPVFDEVTLTNGTPPTATGITICVGGTGTITASGCPPSGTFSTGATNGSAGANVTGIGTSAWGAPGNALANDNSYATVTVNNATSNYLQTSNYGFNIPSGATINGIQVTIGRFQILQAGEMMLEIILFSC